MVDIDFSNVTEWKIDGNEITSFVYDGKTYWCKKDGEKYVIMTSKSGTECKFLTADTTQTITYDNRNRVVQSPYKLCAEISTATNLGKVEDQTNEITATGTFAFYNCTYLSSVILPAVQLLATNAFYGCTSLTSIDIPKVTTINGNALGNCKTLSTLYAPDLTSIYSSGWSGASALVSVYVDNDVLHSIGNGYGTNDQLIVDSNESCLVKSVPGTENIKNDNIISVGYYGCSNGSSQMILKSVELPNAEYIGGNAFYENRALSSVSIPQAKGIGYYSFNYCKALQSVDFPEATFLDYTAFGNCTSLSVVNIPKVQVISSFAFQYDTALCNVYIDEVDDPPVLGTAAFSNTNDYYKIYIKNQEVYQKFIKNTKTSLWINYWNHLIYKGLTPQVVVVQSGSGISYPFLSDELPSTTFAYINGNKVVQYPYNQIDSLSNFNNCQSVYDTFNYIETIGANSFYQCTNLKTVSFPAVKNIEYDAFCQCSNLSSVSIPTVTSIGNSAFQNCTNLSNIYIDGVDEPPTLGQASLIATSDSLKVWVKNEEVYNKFIIDTNWVSFASHITYEGKES